MLNRQITSLRRSVLDRLVLRPTRDEITVATQQRVMWKTAGGNLETFVHRSKTASESPDLLVLKFPGTAGRAERSSRFPADLLTVGSQRCGSADVWTWNPPGYGRSSGRATLSSVIDASLEFWHQVTSQYSDAAMRIWLCGNSLGCATALYVAATLRPDPHRTALVLRNPPPLIPVVKRVAHRYPLGRLIDAVADTLDDRMNAALTAAEVNLPAIFLQSQLDSLVPPAIQRQVTDAYAGAKQVVTMEGLEHDGMPDEYQEIEIRDALDWLWDQSVVTERVVT